ncbi:protein glass [Culicoides brevitarsis]|uniref:protein glass n=1 Tax=Culicoides brevitarsis TaxID=469753 RepID=UPI00307BF127
MYITCGDHETGAASVEPVETGYVPNNPLFSLSLDSPQECPSSICDGSCNFSDHPSLPLPGIHDCGSCLDHNGVLSSQSTLGSSYWNEDMSTFSNLPPLDIEPLPSLFPFSPCGTSFKSERPSHDVADVLLSLKHSGVIKPPQEPSNQYTNNQNNASYQTPQASLSYTVHPQMLVSPSHTHQSSQGQNVPFSTANYYEPGACSMQHPPLYPSMSVNVSMNMTMHGYPNGPEVPMQCSQMQWPPQNTSSSVNVLYPPLLSPGAYPNGATYSFTADFRPQPTTNTSSSSSLTSLTSSTNANQNLSIDTSSPHKIPSASNIPPLSPKQYYQAYPMPSQSPICGIAQQTSVRVKSPKELKYEDEEDSQDGVYMPQNAGDLKPNMCGLCKKTYARPSTLKTHLRTHSGERPYRCPDCSKSFSQAANLTAHVRTHTGQKPFSCPVCNRKFSQSSSVTTHMRTHSGERPYRCKFCRKAFSDSSTLTKHLRIHSGEKPYQCKLCLLRFSQSGNLNRHMRVHGTNGTLLA